MVVSIGYDEASRICFGFTLVRSIFWVSEQCTNALAFHGPHNARTACEAAHYEREPVTTKTVSPNLGYLRFQNIECQLTVRSPFHRPEEETAASEDSSKYRARDNKTLQAKKRQRRLLLCGNHFSGSVIRRMQWL
jgi:hypothetical protein